MTKTPLISVLTPAYNAGKYLADLLDSVAAQDFERYEYVVIDDGSTDNTKEILANRANANPGLRWYSRPNKGQYETQNELLRLAQGEFICIICADDMFASPGVLSLVAKQFGQAPDLDVLFGRTPRYCPYIFDPDLPRWLARPLMRYLLCVQHCSLFVRREFLLGSNLYFDNSHQMRGDWDWMIRVFRATDRIQSVSAPLALWRYHPEQTSVVNRDAGQRESRRVCAAYGSSFVLHRLLGFAAFVYSQTIHVVTLLRVIGLGAVARKVLRSLRLRIRSKYGRAQSGDLRVSNR
jgi:glycosyltransferase involved in cell wall biosynthesis